MNEQAKALLQFVISENRVWPKRWHKFHEIVKRTHLHVPNPLTLGGSTASDKAKRIVLLRQIHEIIDDPMTLDRADAFLRNEPASAWHLAPEPLSNRNSYGHEDASPLMQSELLA